MTRINENLQESVPRLIQDEAMRIMKERQIGYDELAEKLEMFPEDARRLLSPNNWPATTGFRVLDALGVEIDISIK